MMQLGLSARDRRTLIVGGSVVGTLFLLGRGLPRLNEWQSSQITEAATLANDLTAARSGARLMPALRDTLRARQARLSALDSAILTGPTSSAAAASLASALEDLATEASVKVSAMQLQADSPAAGALVQVGVRMTAVADVYGLLALMRAIEGGRQLLAIRELAVTQPEPAAPSNKAEQLRLDLTVVGLARIAVEKR
jgi:hypothetical protein